MRSNFGFAFAAAVEFYQIITSLIMQGSDSELWYQQSISLLHKNVMNALTYFP